MSTNAVTSSFADLDGLIAATQLPLTGVSAASYLYPGVVTVDQYGRVTAITGRANPLAIGDTIGGATAGRVPYWGASGVLADSADLTFSAGSLNVAGGGILSSRGGGRVLAGNAADTANLSLLFTGSVPSLFSSTTLDFFANSLRVGGIDALGQWSFTSNLTVPTLFGSASASGNLTLQSTSHTTLGSLFLNGATTSIGPAGTLGMGISPQSRFAFFMALSLDGASPAVYQSQPLVIGSAGTASIYMSGPSLRATTGIDALRHFYATDVTPSGGALPAGIAQYGLLIDDLTACSTNYAIYTGVGGVRLGDNTAFFADGSFGGGSKVIFVANAAVPPTASPVGGILLWAEGGALKARGSSGTVTILAAA